MEIIRQLKTKTKKIRLILFSSIISCYLFSCNEAEEGYIVSETDPSLLCGIPAEGGIYNVQFKTNQDWKISGLYNLISNSDYQYSGEKPIGSIEFYNSANSSKILEGKAGNYNLTIRFGKSFHFRYGKIEIKTNDDCLEFETYQAGPKCINKDDAINNRRAEELNFPQEGGYFMLQIRPLDQNYQLKDLDWLTQICSYKEKKQNADSYKVYHVSPNNTGKPRSGKIKTWLDTENAWFNFVIINQQAN